MTNGPRLPHSGSQRPNAAGTCRQLIVKLIDGSERIALFLFNGNGRNTAASEAEGNVTVAQQQIFLPLVNR